MGIENLNQGTADDKKKKEAEGAMMHKCNLVNYF
jgi:hypothetical protein